MAPSDDQWSDAPESLVEDNASIQTEPRVVEAREEAGLQALKLLADPPKVVEQTQAVDAQTDAASVRSMPAVHGPSESSLNVARSSSPRPHSPLRPPSSPARPSVARPSTPQERRNGRRSVTDSRPSNRLSGFLNNLIHRREPPQTSSRSPTVREEPQPSPSAKNSRASSPVSAPTRPITPPPSLPPPTLQELGLSLSVLTSDLSPGHFSTPPTSGAFLSPHYLLLCHAQGLDVLPLKSPPAPQPYALIRRVAFKSIVVMELRGVLVAIAGRRDGVRVYALEEIKKAVEWRMDFEIKREKEKERSKTPKKVTSTEFGRDSTETVPVPPRVVRRSSFGATPTSSAPLIPRKPTIRKPKTATGQPPPPSGPPPPYHVASSHTGLAIPPDRTRRTSVTEVLTRGASEVPPENDTKTDWHSSDEEAIDVVAAPSGSQALDERTSSQAGTSPSQPIASTSPVLSPRTSFSRRNRPANLDLSMTRGNSGTTVVPQPEPSPAPTLITLQQALSATPQETVPTPMTAEQADTDEDGEGPSGEGRISLAQALSESRLPDLPPAGTRRQQQPIFITNSHPIATGDDDGPSSPRTSESVSILSRTGTERTRTSRNRRRWSVLEGVFSNNISTPNIPTSTSEMGEITAQRSGSVGTLPAATPSSAPARRTSTFVRTSSHRSVQSVVEPASTPASNSSSPPPVPPMPVGNTINPLSNALITSPLPTSPPRSRFIPRIISNAFHHRKSEDTNQTTAVARPSDLEGVRRSGGSLVIAQAPPPKLEYVKLPGTKGALLVKAVETAKKSFLAILCGDNGEKVELFAGTYRTALGLSRTFILPDSPRSLELQLQGDDLVEVFLVFNQNVFGLEPATVRVREVRIGRAERRAARRRARELREDAAAEGDPAADDDVNVNVSIGVSVSSEQPNSDTSLIPAEHPNGPSTPNERPATATASGEEANVTATSAAIAHADEVLAMATVQMGPYTTFQQLSFAPKFPLASIADEYIIPPTYPDFLDYRNMYEQESGEGSTDLAQIQFSPPGLPVPTPTAPSRWYYRDPKNVIHGPWKASLMQAWYKDGLLPPDLPVRREEEPEYTLLKDLRAQSVDPSHPFRAPPPPPLQSGVPPLTDGTKPLLTPISLLAQPRHFGPPALFFSSRGGHSTTIVDARGRSVLKGRFLWSEDPEIVTGRLPSLSRMGDIKRVEAFDVKGDRAVLVAMRQGGLEAVDLGDALLRPADESRTVLPQFVVPPSNLSRRSPFVWRIGTPVSSGTSNEEAAPLSKPKSSHILPTKKLSTGPSGRGDYTSGDGHGDGELKEEVLFLGRKEDDVYLCERNAGSFRILRLSSAV